MASLEESMKTVVLKGMETLGKGAAGLASMAQEKINGMNAEARCAELRREIADVAMQLNQEGVELPEKLDALVKKLAVLDSQHAEKASQTEATPAQNDSAQPVTEAIEEPAEAEAAEKAEEPNPCESVKSGLEQIAVRAGKVVGAAMDAVGSLVGSAVEMFKNAAEEDPLDAAEDAHAAAEQDSEDISADAEQDSEDISADTEQEPADIPDASETVPADEPAAQDDASEDANG